MDRLTDYDLEQSQRSAAQLFDVMKQTVTASVDMLNWAQSEAQRFGSSLTQQGAEQFLSRLEQLQTQQLAAHKEFEEQFRSLLNIYQNEGSR
ncbi:hypothetical protein ACTID9_03815 [Brevibacillus fluminis]|uniref:hypothetical protein n=1 Tax=Brevibacillus fluminis TaxID=511487 RepID=UPI003F894DD5